LGGCGSLISGRNSSSSQTPKAAASASLEGVPAFSAIQTEAGSAVGSHSGSVLDLRVVNPTNQQAISIGTDGRILGWDIRTGAGRALATLPSPPIAATFGAHKALVAYSSGKSITVTCVQGCPFQWTLTKIKARVAALAFHDNDEALLIGGSDGRVYRWRYIFETSASDVRERERALERYMGHQTLISAVASLPVGRAFFSADWDGNLIGWLPYSADDFGGKYDKNLFNGSFFGQATTSTRAARPLDRGISSLSLTPDGSRVIVGTEEGDVEVWEVRGFSLTARAHVHNGRVLSVAPNADGTLIASAGRDGTVHMQKLEKDPLYLIGTNARPHLLRSLTQTKVEGVRSALLLPNSSLLITTAGGGVGEVRFQDLEGPPATGAITPPKPPITDLERIEKDSDY
jgi:WD40 repeat protein